MTSPDLIVAHFMSAHSHRSWTIDSVMVTLADNEFLKGLVLVLFWWAWTARTQDREKRRKVLLATLPAPFLAFFLGRALAHLLPYRIRPLADPSLHWRFAEGVSSTMWARTWSSMPSDHAACFAAIACSLFFASRRIGIIALAYTLLIVDLPRVYLGMHYVSDILAGTLLGILVASVLASRPLRAITVPPLLQLKRAQPALFYSGLFTCLYIVGCINSVHALFQLTSDSVRAWTHHSSAVRTSANSGVPDGAHLMVIVPPRDSQ